MMPLMPQMVLSTVIPVWETTTTFGTMASDKSNYLKYGYRSSPALGTIADSTIDFLSSAPINEIAIESSLSGVNSTELIIGASLPNSGWSALVALTASGVSILERSAAVYTSGNPSKWKWNEALAAPNLTSFTIGFLP